MLKRWCRWVLKGLCLAIGAYFGFGFGFGALEAQTFGEWFNQKKTQKNYLLAQIAALQTYMNLLETGYGMAKSGLGTIAELKEGDFLQHQLYFNSLTTVDARVRDYQKVGAIARLEDQSAAIRNGLLKCEDWYLLSINERADFEAFNTWAAAETKKDLAFLEMLLTDKVLVMTDDERISGIDNLYAEVKRKYSLAVYMCRAARALLKSRAVSLGEGKVMRWLYGE